MLEYNENLINTEDEEEKQEISYDPLGNYLSNIKPSDLRLSTLRSPPQDKFVEEVEQIKRGGGESIADFQKDPEVIKRYENILSYFSENKELQDALIDPATFADDDKDISEFMRDENIRIITKLRRAAKLKDAPESIKEDYRYLQDRWENSEFKSMADVGEAFKEYGSDVLFNYETIPLILSLFGGPVGVGGAATVQAGARAALSKALARTVSIAAPTTAKGSAAYAGTFAGLDNYAMQELDISTNKRNEIDPLEIGISTAIGAGLGYGLTKGIGYIGSKINKNKVERAFEDEDLFEDAGFSDDFSERARRAFEAAEEPVVPPTGTDIVEDNLRTYDPTLLETQVPEDIIPPYTPQLIEDLTERFSTTSPTPEDIASIPEVNAFVNDIGGGSRTAEEIIDIVTAASNQGDPVKVKSYIMNKLYRMTAGVVSNWYGKSAGIFTPYTSYSPAAKVLQTKFAREFAKNWTGPQAMISEDFAEAQKKITGKYFDRYLRIVEPIADNKLKGKMKDEVNDQLSRAIRGQRSSNQRINYTATKIKNMYEELGDALFDAGFIKFKVDNYVPRMWNRSAIEKNPEDFQRLLIEEGEAANPVEAKRIFEEMLDKENQLDAGTHGHFFSAKRKFENIKDDSKFEEFLNTDVASTFYTYIFQAGKSLAKKRVFGVKNAREFENRWLNQIIIDHKNATGKSLPKAERERIKKLYRITTGELTKEDRLSEGWQTVADGYNLITRMSTLSLATLSSLSEVLVNISKAGALNSVKGFSEAAEASFKRITRDTHSALQTNHGLTAQEAWRELYEHGLAVDQSLSQLGNRLVGEDLVNEKMQSASNMFFRANLLDQWTKFSQLVGYSTGKRLITNNLKDIIDHGNAKVSKRIQNKMDELAELGIDLEKGKAWIMGGSRLDDPFYQEIKAGAARYTNDVILQPNAMSNIKPTLHANPQTTALFQLLSYPAAFTNVILKGAAKQLVRNPTSNAGKVVIAGLLMTETQRYLNYLRSRGKSEEDKTPAEARLQAVRRWGGNGLFLDQLERANNTASYSKNIMAYSLLPFGPLPAEAVQAFGSRTPIQVLGRKVPGYSAMPLVLGPEFMEAYKQKLKEGDKAVKEILPDRPSERIEFAKGGEVNVPNAKTEPDERIDRMTGLPYNIQAGSAFIDEEDSVKSLLG